MARYFRRRQIRDSRGTFQKPCDFGDHQTGVLFAFLVGVFRTLGFKDLAALTLVTFVASTGVPAWLGLHDRLSVAALTMGLACPAARRLIAWRRGAEPIRFGANGASSPVLLAAMLPWIIIPGLRTLPWAAVSSLATAQVPLPLFVRVAGTAIAIVGVLRPMVHALNGTTRIRSAAYVETVGLFLATGNIFLGTLAAAWLLVSAQRNATREADVTTARPLCTITTS